MAIRYPSTRFGRLGAWAFVALLSWLPAAPAQLLEEIQVAEDNGFARLRLGFATPVRYVRHFPPEHGEIVKIFLQSLALEEIDEADRVERRRGFTSDFIPPFTVTYTARRDCDNIRNPVCLTIQFKEPVSYTLRVGDDGRSLSLFVPLASRGPTR
jgi:hypothetical protein